MRKYPTSLQTFSEIVEGEYVYVDKTEHVKNLVSTGKYYFLSRPRRFGKSILTSTFKSLFEGKRELFRSLHIEDKWNWNEKNPVLHFSFERIAFEKFGLEKALMNELHSVAEFHGIEVSSDALNIRLEELIKKLYESKGKVVVLIDEYDKPINHYLGIDSEKAIENRNIMKNFYSVLKSADPYLRFVFITGVSKFAKVSIFSDLNNLEDITFHTKYGGICGISQQEMESVFSEELHEHDKEKIKQWYNGYTWDLNTWVYNPFSLIRFFSGKKFENFWFDSGTPTFLINLLKEKRQFNFSSIEVTLSELGGYNLENIHTVALMFQTGYLTLDSQDEISQTYFLKFPNKEVEMSFNQLLLDAYAGTSELESGFTLVTNMRRALVSGDLSKLKDYLNTLFKTIPSNLWEKHSEDYFHSILHLAFKLLAFQISSEVKYADGTVDSIVEVADKIYVIEVKLDKSVQEAFEQISNKGYADAYKHSSKKVIEIAVNFSSKEKKIVGFESKEAEF